MSVKSAQAITVAFDVLNPYTGALANADSLPTGVLVVNGVDNAATVTVTNVGVGRYRAAVTMPTLAAGDSVQLHIAATVAAVAAGGIAWSDAADSARPGEVKTVVDAIKPKTDNLPSDPADESLLEAAIAAVAETLAGIDLSGLGDLSDLLAAIEAVKAKTDTIGALAVTVTSPVAESGTVTIYQGDDYSSEYGRELSFAVADASHVYGLDGAEVVLKCSQAQWDAASVTETDTGYTVTFEPTRAQTTALTVTRQTYELEATLADGDVVTLARGTLAVVLDIPAK